jgi:acyl-CoA reductase-like NAD-dependent aldehyde dehydrogenase
MNEPNETTRKALDRAVADLRRSAPRWVAVPLERRLAYMREIVRRVPRVVERWNEAAADRRGTAPDALRAGETMIAGPGILTQNLRVMTASLKELQERGAIQIAANRVRLRHDGQVVLELLPDGISDRLIWTGMRGEVWLDPEVRREGLQEELGGFYESGQVPEPSVALVLGAGNVDSIPALDAVQKLFVEDQVPLIKLNPVNAYVAPVFEHIFGELIHDGFIRLVTGGADVGAYLTAHKDIDTVHVTGSTDTHDLIVFGRGEEGERRRREHDPLLTKPITSELGNVSPAIVVPGEWSAAELDYQAENLATQIAQNAGYNCNASKVIITSAAWPQREELLGRIKRILREDAPRHHWYPGSAERWERFVGSYADAEVLGERGDDVQPPALLLGLSPDDDEARIFRREPFCLVTGEVALPQNDPTEFLFAAVDFSNRRLFGDLSATIIVDPRTARRLGHNLEDAIAELHYGAVSVNVWAAAVYGLGMIPWGAAPGNTLENVASGIGWVHNGRLIKRPQKSVLYGPFRGMPKPPWFITHRNALRTGRRLVDYEVNPGPLKIATLAAAALRG